MIESLTVKHYKCMEHLSLEKLGRVNLIVGKNNVGKSTLLEVLSVFAASGDAGWLSQLLDWRGEGVHFHANTEALVQKKSERFASLYMGRDMQAFYTNPIDIQIEGPQGTEKVQVGLVKVVNVPVTDSQGLTTITRKVVDPLESLDYNPNATIGIRSWYEHKDSVRSALFLLQNPRPPQPEYLMRFEYVRTSEADMNAALFDRIALSPLETSLVDALRIIEPRVKQVNFLADNDAGGAAAQRRIPMVVLEDVPGRQRLTAMGDGMNRILTIVLALLNCQNGLLLIDEFENGLHYSVQRQLWRIIFQLAEQLNIQVFATTHSNDAVRSFAQESVQDIGKFIRLEQQKSGIVGVAYDDLDDLRFALDQDMEVR